MPIFRNPVILKQLGISVGIPFGLLTLILVFVSGKSIHTLGLNDAGYGKGVGKKISFGLRPAQNSPAELAGEFLVLGFRVT